MRFFPLGCIGFRSIRPPEHPPGWRNKKTKKAKRKESRKGLKRKTGK